MYNALSERYLGWAWTFFLAFQVQWDIPAEIRWEDVSSVGMETSSGERGETYRELNGVDGSIPPRRKSPEQKWRFIFVPLQGQMQRKGTRNWQACCACVEQFEQCRLEYRPDYAGWHAFVIAYSSKSQEVFWELFAFWMGQCIQPCWRKPTNEFSQDFYVQWAVLETYTKAVGVGLGFYSLLAFEYNGIHS